MSTARVIFLAEDDPDDQDFFIEAVKTLGEDIRVQIAVNGEKAIQQLAQLQQTPDFIFLDLNMPVMNGLECLKILRANKTLANTPIFIYTTYCSNKHKEEAQKLGVTEIFYKPYSIKELTQLLRRIL